MYGAHYAVADTRKRPSTSLDREQEQRRELQRFFLPKYVGLAFDLPPACGTFWGLMEEEIEKYSFEDGHEFCEDVEDAVTFLRLFFSANLVAGICGNLGLLKKSFLGIRYTLRPGKAGFAKNVLHDVRQEIDLQESPLHGFLGHVSFSCDSDVDDVDAPSDAGEEGWQTRQRRQTWSTAGSSSKGRNGVSSEERSVRGGHSSRRRAGRSLGGGRGTGQTGTLQVHFATMLDNTVMVPMSPHQSLRARSWKFISHSLVGNHSNKMYDPNICESGSVTLFHGTRAGHLKSFQSHGIAPLFTRNEFSMREAFYVSNSIRQAYEHPLHYHPSRFNLDNIIVFGFEVDVAVLHGFEPPPGELTPFMTLQFPDTEEDMREWQGFCKSNFMLEGSCHSYDIVIGPVCLPRDEGDFGKLEVKLPRDAPCTQIAFCSTRSRSWLERCFKKLFVERRGKQDQNPLH